MDKAAVFAAFCRRGALHRCAVLAAQAGAQSQLSVQAERSRAGHGRYCRLRVGVSLLALVRDLFSTSLLFSPMWPLHVDTLSSLLSACAR